MTNPGHEKEQPRTSVAVYLVDRRWGAAEEGGWWYDTGTLADTEALGLRDAAPRSFNASDIGSGEHAPFVAHLVEEIERSGANLERFPPGDVRSTGWHKPCLRDGPAADWNDYEPWQ